MPRPWPIQLGRNFGKKNYVSKAQKRNYNHSLVGLPVLRRPVPSTALSVPSNAYSQLVAVSLLLENRIIMSISKKGHHYNVTKRG